MQKEAQDEIDDYEGKKKDQKEDYDPDTNGEFSLDDVDRNVRLLLDSYMVTIPGNEIVIDF